MKYPIFAAALLALAITACDKKDPPADPSGPGSTSSEEQSPAPGADAMPPLGGGASFPLIEQAPAAAEPSATEPPAGDAPAVEAK